MKNNLINKWMMAFSTLVIALTLSLAPANGQQKNNQARQEKPPIMVETPNKPQAATKVTLKCEQDGVSDVTAKVKITNITSQTIAKGTKIYWQTAKGLKASFNVYDSNGLQPNESIKDSNGDDTDQGPCTAYYMKK